MNQLWYYAKNGTPVGPVTFAVLKQMAATGQLAPSDLIRSQGMADWIPASNVKELFAPRDPYAPPVPALAAYRAGQVTYAGFWKRFAAAILDGLILTVGSFPVQFIFGFAIAFNGGTEEEAELISSVLAAVSWLYYACMESSPLQATLGKLALGIKVTDYHGNRIGFGRATGRYFAKILSFLTFFIGFIMAGLTKKKQALHDIVAGCLVVNR